jgi:DNA replication and repair protein RecF
VGFSPGEPKHLRVDGAPVERLLDAPGRPLVSVFLPDRLELVKGAPSLRRAHVDQLVAALWPARASTRRAYGHALAQRNALLGRVRAGGSRAALAAWDLELARHGIALRDDRARAVALLTAPFGEAATELGLPGSAELRFRPRSRAASAEGLAEELAERLEADLERGFTTHGPHRDDLALLRDGRELRVFGSQGEQRLGLLALLLAEREALGAERGSPPLLLLDDVMSELDAERRERLVERLRAGQSVVTTTDLAHVPYADEAGVVRLRVRDGVVAAEELAGA